MYIKLYMEESYYVKTMNDVHNKGTPVQYAEMHLAFTNMSFVIYTWSGLCVRTGIMHHRQYEDHKETQRQQPIFLDLHDKSLMSKWLEQESQWHQMYCHDLEVMISNPSWIELGVLGSSVLSCTWTKTINRQCISLSESSCIWNHHRPLIWQYISFF